MGKRGSKKAYVQQCLSIHREEVKSIMIPKQILIGDTEGVSILLGLLGELLLESSNIGKKDSISNEE